MKYCFMWFGKFELSGYKIVEDFDLLMVQCWDLYCIYRIEYSKTFLFLNFINIFSEHLVWWFFNVIALDANDYMEMRGSHLSPPPLPALTYM